MTKDIFITKQKHNDTSYNNYIQAMLHQCHDTSKTCHILN